MQLSTALAGLLTLTLAFAAGACTSEGRAEAPRVLRFSAIPDDNKTELGARYGRLAAHLSRELGIDVQYVPATEYGASVAAFVNGDVQLAWYGGLTGVQARRQVAGARAIAQGKVDPAFKSYFVAHAGAGVEPSEDFPMALEGKRFTFGPSNSTSGRLMPEHFLRQHSGRSPQEFFGGENHYSPGHDQTAQLVESGAFEAGVLNYVTYERMVAEGSLDPELCLRVWTTPPYPDYNWTAHPMLDEMFGAGFVDRLQAALVGIADPEVLRAIDRPDGLIPASNEDFEPIEALALELGMLR